MNNLNAISKLNFYRLTRLSSLVIIATIFLLFVNSCNTTSTEKPDTRTIPDLVKHLKDSGLKINKTMKVRYEAVLASDGIVMVVNDAKVEFYIYEPSISYQKKKLDYAKKNKSVQVLGITIPCVVNGKFVMFTYTDNPNKMKVIKAFKAFNNDK